MAGLGCDRHGRAPMVLLGRRYGGMRLAGSLKLLLVFSSLLYCAYASKVVTLPLERSRHPNRKARFPRPELLTLHTKQGVNYAPLRGGITAVGEYYATVELGGQKVRVQIDTGSSTMAVPLAECVKCRRGDMRYSMNKSNSNVAAKVKCRSNLCDADTCMESECVCKDSRCCAMDDENMCGFSLLYGDGSGAQGGLVTDVMKWGDVEVQVTFGGILRDSSDFERKEVDGILGMAYPSLSCAPSCVDPVFDVMVKEKVVQHDIFSICMTEHDGTIVLGGYEPSLGKGEPVYEPLKGTPTFYKVELSQNVRIGEHDVEMEEMRAGIVDSGTTLMVFGGQIFDHIVDHLMKYHCDVPDLCSANTWFTAASCVEITEEDLAKLPSFTFPLKDGVSIELLPEHYMLPYDHEGRNMRCVGFMSMQMHGIDVIFGNTINMRYVTIYDRANARIGFVEKAGSCALHPSSNDGGNGTDSGSVPAVGESKCSLMASCNDCADHSECVYNYPDGTCSPRSEHGSVFPFPYCHGRTCFCAAASLSRAAVIAIAAVSAGALFAVLLIGIVLVRRWRQLRQYESAPEANDADYEW